jgi:hypothetical protein
MWKFGLSSQSGGGLVVGSEDFGDGGLLDADEDEETFDEAESDACSLMDVSCELDLESFRDCVVRARLVDVKGGIGR